MVVRKKKCKYLDSQTKTISVFFYHPTILQNVNLAKLECHSCIKVRVNGCDQCECKDSLLVRIVTFEFDIIFFCFFFCNSSLCIKSEYYGHKWSLFIKQAITLKWKIIDPLVCYHLFPRNLGRSFVNKLMVNFMETTKELNNVQHEFR